jgi:ribosome-interacting GTPase 1
VPANLTPQFHDAEERFKAAESAADKVSALEDMLRVIPKHKGTEKMQADLKRRLSKLRKEHQKEKASGGSKRPFHYVEKEGIGRIVISGPANSGKSSLLARLTNAEPEIADYPFTTRAPQPGMMQFEDVQIQLVDMPPLAREVFEPWQIAMLEQAELGVLLFDVTDPLLLDQTAFVLEQLRRRDLALPPSPESRMIFLGNKVDRAEGLESFEAWQELFSGEFEAAPFSIESVEDLLALKKTFFKRLNVVRVYTKPPGGKPEKGQAPYVLRNGSTVLDAAAMIHKDLAETFKFARIWGGGLYEGQMVERDYVLQDGDLLEVHS